MSVQPFGFALRKNGTCEATEVDCGRTVNPYRVCCPKASFCPTQYNIDCCPSLKNCTEELYVEPRCANESWDLYDNGGFFCCEKGLIGYAATTNSNGCASPGYAFKSGEVALEIIIPGQELSSTASDVQTPSSALDTATSSETEASRQTGTESPEPIPSSSSSSSTPTGAIAGGVVGGLAAVGIIGAVLFVLYRGKERRQNPKSLSELNGSPGPAEVESPRVVLEADGGEKGSRPSQLPSHHGVSELPA